MNCNAVFMLTGLSLNKKIKLFNSKAWNLLCLNDYIEYNIFHMDINYLCFCCKSALGWIKRNYALDSFIILFFLFFYSYVANLWI